MLEMHVVGSEDEENTFGNKAAAATIAVLNAATEPTIPANCHRKRRGLWQRANAGAKTFVRRLLRTAKIIARRPSAPTSATELVRVPKKLIRKIVICPCKQKKIAFAAWLRMKPIIAVRSSAFSAALRSTTFATYLRSSHHCSRSVADATDRCDVAFRKTNNQAGKSGQASSSAGEVDGLNATECSNAAAAPH